MNLELTGIIKEIGEVETFPSGFQKRQIVVTEEGTYPQDLAIEFMGDKIDLPQEHKVGNEVTVGINLRGKGTANKEGVIKYYNSLVGWKIVKGNANHEPTQASGAKQESAKQKDVFADDGDDSSENLPF